MTLHRKVFPNRLLIIFYEFFLKYLKSAHRMQTLQLQNEPFQLLMRFLKHNKFAADLM